MGQCKQCKWYDIEFDNTQATMDDMIIEGQPEVEHHYCPCFMYPKHIDPDTYGGDKKCDLFIAE